MLTLKRAVWAVVVIGLAACAQQPAREVDGTGQELRHGGFDFEVTLRATGSASIHATVYRNTRCLFGETILAVPGFAETANMFEPLAAALFADRAFRHRVARVVAIDLVGRGQSGFPVDLPGGARFGDLTIDDNVDVVLQAIEALRARRIPPRTLIGHSMGGLAVASTQQALLDQGSSLAQHGVRRALLLAPVPPHGRPWMQSPPSDLSSAIVEDDQLGTYLSLPPELWLPGLFATPQGEFVPGTPSADETIAGAYIAPEPLTTLLQLVEQPIEIPDAGTITIPRPEVSEGAFTAQHGTLLRLVAFSQDVLVPVSDLADLYSYLSGAEDGRGYRLVDTPDAVHGMFFSNPDELLDAAE
jgi:pimeloyl-ACP methyl ester carboxylesterase